MATKKIRNSNIEFLRCLLMLMIIMLHNLVHGVNGEFVAFFGKREPTYLSEAFFSIFLMGAVDCYILISGYFGIRKSLKSFLSIWGACFFYSITISLIAFLNRKIAVLELIKSFFPIITCRWWFATCYVILFLISNLLECFLESIYNKNKNEFLISLICLICFTFLTDGYTLGNLLGLKSLGFTIFIICYSLGFVIRKSNKELLYKFKIFYLPLYFIASCISCIGTFIVYAIFHKMAWFRISIYASPFTLLSAIGMFLFFLTLKPRFYRGINLLGSVTFDIYLIHECELIRPFLYSTFSLVQYKSNSIVLISLLIIKSLIIFCICSLIGGGRKILFNLVLKAFTKNKKIKGVKI